MTTHPARALAGFDRRQQGLGGRPESLDDYFARLADSVPGFAALYYDSQGDAVVRMVDDTPAKRAVVVATLARFLREGASGRRGHQPAVRVERARHDARALMRWRRWAIDSLMGRPEAN
ncbi:MAG TPA: hypothetical protein VJ867_13705, partial [Gemmatimonadaceae bacterium]|nr:hypothetical protein [Gemmatimonadaceae bacterium]